ncbi:MAG: hypothetical protein VB141_11210 [Burkholderia gladioli]
MSTNEKKNTLPLPVICFIALVAILAWCGLHPEDAAVSNCSVTKFHGGKS